MALRRANPALTARPLYREAFIVGRQIDAACANRPRPHTSAPRLAGAEVSEPHAAVACERLNVASLMGQAQGVGPTPCAVVERDEIAGSCGRRHVTHTPGPAGNGFFMKLA